jgi:hypothetical protein
MQAEGLDPAGFNPAGAPDSHAPAPAAADGDAEGAPSGLLAEILKGKQLKKVSAEATSPASTTASAAVTRSPAAAPKKPMSLLEEMQVCCCLSRLPASVRCTTWSYSCPLLQV